MSKCTVADCFSPVKYKGLCSKHYKRQWRHGNPETTLINMSGDKGKCCVENCDREARIPSYAMCNKHYNMFYRHGRTERIIAPAGNGTINGGGYRLLTINGERKYEHVVIAEKALGKLLPEKAVVHHVNGIPSDNRPENLVICQDQAYHLLLHRRQELLERGVNLNVSEL